MCRTVSCQREVPSVASRQWRYQSSRKEIDLTTSDRRRSPRKTDKFRLSSLETHDGDPILRRIYKNRCDGCDGSQGNCKWEPHGDGAKPMSKPGAAEGIWETIGSGIRTANTALYRKSLRPRGRRNQEQWVDPRNGNKRSTPPSLRH